MDLCRPASRRARAAAGRRARCAARAVRRSARLVAVPSAPVSTLGRGRAEEVALLCDARAGPAPDVGELGAEEAAGAGPDRAPPTAGGTPSPLPTSGGAWSSGLGRGPTGAPAADREGACPTKVTCPTSPAVSRGRPAGGAARGVLSVSDVSRGGRCGTEEAAGAGPDGASTTPHVALGSCAVRLSPLPRWGGVGEAARSRFSIPPPNPNGSSSSESYHSLPSVSDLRPGADPGAEGAAGAGTDSPTACPARGGTV